MQSKLTKKYGIFTAVCTVVGIVIGSGIFFKASKVLDVTGGSLQMALLTVGVVGVIMLICSYIFSILAGRYEKVNGIVDYAESAVGRSYGYMMAWFMTTIYTPVLTAILAWVTARYTASFLGFSQFSMEAAAFAAMYLILGFAVNSLSPKLGGKVQVATTVIKMIPIVLMAVVGTIVGVIRGTTVQAFVETTRQMTAGGSSIMTAIVAFAFAYEGWIVATTINSELKNSKKNLPRALIIGAIIIILVYLAYFVGLSGSMPVNDLIRVADLPKEAFSSVFGGFAGSIIYVFIIISCYGTMNALMMGCIRNAYSLGARDEGVCPELYSQVCKKTNAPYNSAIIGLLLSGFWLAYIYVCWTASDITQTAALPDFVTWEPDELPIITLYAGYIPIFISMMIKEKDLNWFKRFAMPILGLLSSVFMVYCAIVAYGMDSLYYLIFFVIVMAIGVIFYFKKKRPAQNAEEA